MAFYTTGPLRRIVMLKRKSDDLANLPRGWHYCYDYTSTGGKRCHAVYVDNKKFSTGHSKKEAADELFRLLSEKRVTDELRALWQYIGEDAVAAGEYAEWDAESVRDVVGDRACCDKEQTPLYAAMFAAKQYDECDAALLRAFPDGTEYVP